MDHNHPQLPMETVAGPSGSDVTPTSRHPSHISNSNIW